MTDKVKVIEYLTRRSSQHEVYDMTSLTFLRL